MKKTDLNIFNTGSTHESNPLGGIPMGTDMNGQSNSVEQGETKFKDFVYSDRIKLTKDLIGNYNLPKNLNNKSIAEASKFINNKFKDRTDKISESTKKGMLDNLSQIQEEIKATEQSEIPDTNQMFLGGSTIDPSSILSSVQGGLSLVNQAKGNTSSNTLDASLNGITTGASAGMALGPYGAAIGGALGGISGLIGSNKAKDKELDLAKVNSIIQNNQYTNDFAFGGDLRNPVTAISDTDPFKELALNQGLVNQYSLDKFTSPTSSPVNTPPIASPIEGYNSPFNKANLKPIADFAKNNFGNALRYAPIATNAIQLAGMDKPSYESLNRLDNRFKPAYVDETSIQNIAGNELDNVSNSLTNAANGSTGALRNALLGASLNKTKALSDAYLKASDINRQQDNMSQEFNSNIDRTNLQQSNLELDINDRNQAAYSNNKSRLISAIGEDLGNVGKEEVYKKIARETFGYTWQGKYYTDQNGNKKTPEEVKAEIDASQSNQKKLGGYLMTKKK